MPVLQGALLCDAAHDYNGLVSVLGGFVNMLRIQSFPAISPIWFAGRVGFGREEMRSRGHVLLVRAVTDSGQLLAEVRADAGPQDPGERMGSELMGGANLVFPFPFPISGPGMYWVELHVDDIVLSRLPLKVSGTAE